MKDTEMKSGMKVWLLSGSPAMTVNRKNGLHGWLCNWFDGNKPMADSYAAEQLTDKDPEHKAGTIGR